MRRPEKCRVGTSGSLHGRWTSVVSSEATIAGALGLPGNTLAQVRGPGSGWYLMAVSTAGETA